MRFNAPWLEVNQEWRDQEKYADDAKPEQIVGEIRIDTQQYAGKHWRDLSLPLPINEVSHPDCARDDADDETIHVRARMSVNVCRLVANAMGL